MFDTSILEEALRSRRQRLDSEQADLLGRVDRTLRDLRSEYGIGEAYVIGSLVPPRRWHQSSDVDVAVGGCSGNVLEVMRELEETTGREVDVVDLDRHPFPDLFRRQGLRIYG